MHLSESTFREIRDYIYEKSGIFIADTKKYLIDNRLSRVLQEKNLTSFEEYLRIIKYSSNGTELSRLFDAVTTNETYFYREPHQLTVLVEEIIPEVIRSLHAAQSVKIWSAACSTGEEPYTISIMLMEKPTLPKRIQMFASDLSQGVLESAKKAIFSSYSVRNAPPQHLKRYFSIRGQDHVLNEEVRKSVRFMRANLMDNRELKQLRGMDIILCRNVLIYFDARSKQRAVSNLYDNLNPGGYLIIGSSESLHNVTRAFRPVVINRVIAYQKVQR
ncbi:MAG: protein-glutamate O-methyltransferase CheR [Nitrospiraceae bacterium]|nr:MAG: protein-glutamate O-methyltransferase CheR [Nitrospiraceae bacterium]